MISGVLTQGAGRRHIGSSTARAPARWSRGTRNKRTEGLDQTFLQRLVYNLPQESVTVSQGVRWSEEGASRGCRIASAPVTRLFLAASFSAVCMTGSLLYADSSVVAESLELWHNFTTTLAEEEELWKSLE